MIDQHNTAIGGYFSLELPKAGQHFYPQARLFSCARSAFMALLLRGKPSAVWMPDYICDAMLAPLHDAAIAVKFYALDERLMPQQDIHPGETEWLFYVNYFGLHSLSEAAILERFAPERVIFDHAQAFYAPPQACLATLYSPRKFFGVPDGGLIVTDLPLAMPEADTSHSLNRLAHLFERLACDAEYGFPAYQHAEMTLSSSPLAMSKLTDTLLKRIDYHEGKRIREANFNYLDRQLKDLNTFQFNREGLQGPLCYPFLPRKKGLRDYLRSQRIYIPGYWQDARKRISPPRREYELVENLLPLPVDQRYGEEEMAYIVKHITCFLHNA